MNIDDLREYEKLIKEYEKHRIIKILKSNSDLFISEEALNKIIEQIG